MKARAVDGSTDRFATQADEYFSARPVYPAALVDGVVQSVPRRQLAVDVGTGSGQLAADLSPSFTQVVAVDKSPAQLSRATQRPNVTYRPGVATALPVTVDHSDLITVAQCYHWLLADQTAPDFLVEARRVLSPAGRLAILGYGVCRIVGLGEDHESCSSNAEAAQKIFDRFYYDELGSHLPPESAACWWDILIDACWIDK